MDLQDLKESLITEIAELRKDNKKRMLQIGNLDNSEGSDFRGLINIITQNNEHIQNKLGQIMVLNKVI